MPLFSIVIPTYNRARLLEETLASVFAQEETDYEVLVVDDGSTDDTLETLARYGERVRVFQQRNAGPGAARNLGIQEARGDYVVFLDSDDLWFPWTLATYRQVLREQGGPSVVMGTAASFARREELAGVTREPSKVVRFADYLASAEDRTPRTACVVAVRTDALRRVGGFTPLRINGEDYDLLYRLGTEPGFAWVRAPVTVGYRQHGGSSSRALGAELPGHAVPVGAGAAGALPGRCRPQARAAGDAPYNLRHVSQWLLSLRRVDLALALYRRGLPFHLAAPRWRYVLGFPPWAVATTVRQRMAKR